MGLGVTMLVFFYAANLAFQTFEPRLSSRPLAANAMKILTPDDHLIVYGEFGAGCAASASTSARPHLDLQRPLQRLWSLDRILLTPRRSFSTTSSLMPCGRAMNGLFCSSRPNSAATALAQLSRTHKFSLVKADRKRSTRISQLVVLRPALGWNPIDLLHAEPLASSVDRLMNSESLGFVVGGGSDDGVLIVPRPRGFCAGVVRAIDIVRIALQKVGPPVYVRKEIVHNRHVVAELAEAGAIFVDELAQALTEPSWCSARTESRRLFVRMRRCVGYT